MHGQTVRLQLAYCTLQICQIQNQQQQKQQLTVVMWGWSDAKTDSQR